MQRSKTSAAIKHVREITMTRALDQFNLKEWPVRIIHIHLDIKR